MTMASRGRASRHRLPLWIAALAIGGSGLWWAGGPSCRVRSLVASRPTSEAIGMKQTG